MKQRKKANFSDLFTSGQCRQHWRLERC